MSPTSPRKSPPDWDVIEPHYRAGIRTLKSMGDEFGVSDAAIHKHAKKNGWTRNLKAKIRNKVKEKVSAALVSKQVSEKTKITEAIRVDIESEVMARIQIAHRTSIARARTATTLLLSELEAICGPDAAAMLAELGELLRSPDDRGVDRLNDIYKTIISLPERAKTMKSLADSLRVLVDMERTAFSMDEDAGEGGSGNDKPMSDAELAVRLFQVFGSKQA